MPFNFVAMATSSIHVALRLLLLAVVWDTLGASQLSYSAGGARARFEEKFINTCSKYSFVKKYNDLMENPNTDGYMLFVFHEAGQKAHGGLGDRLAGMVSAVAYAIRTGRTFLIQGDEAFEDSFQPYYNASSPESAKNSYSWRNWDWAKWDRSFASNMTTQRCINPRPDWTHCALDYHQSNREFKVIKYYGNRSYLCRWNLKGDKLGISRHLARILQIRPGVDLFEIAGCLLRLAIWPTEKLWNALDDSLQGQFTERGSAQTAVQVGFHFRCGDSSFATAGAAAEAAAQGKKLHHKQLDPAMHPNPECYFDSELPWKGTSFSDDLSLESPIDEAGCGRRIINGLLGSNSPDPNPGAGNSGDGGIGTQRTTGVSNIGIASALSSSATSLAPAPQHQQQSQSLGGEGDHGEGILAYIASDNGDSSYQVSVLPFLFLSLFLPLYPPLLCQSP